MIHIVFRPLKPITQLDVLWGLVLLGLLISQVFDPHTFPQQSHSASFVDHQADLPIHFLVELLVSGQFERMGSFLLGLGLYQCVQQAQREEQAAQRIAQRLLIGLLGIGFILSVGLRSVDLLGLYALLGLCLLYVRNQSTSSLLRWLVSLACLAIGVPCCVDLIHAANVMPHDLLGWQAISEWLRSGRSVSQGFGPTLSYGGGLLAGWLVGKLGVAHLDTRLRVRLSLFQVVILPVAFLLKGVWVVMALGLVGLPQLVVDYQPALLALSGFGGPLLLTGVYLLELGVTSQSAPTGWTRWPGQVGQMGVTNYVLQSVLGQLLLYGFDRVVPGGLPFWTRTGIVVVIYSVQLGLSHVWSKHHRQGPLEWVLHQWISGKPDQSAFVTPAKR